MPGIPRRREPHEGSTYLTEMVGRRFAEVRRLRHISQEKVADGMVELGHDTWKRQTVGQIETGARNITVDELAALAAVLHTSIAFLMSPDPPWKDQSDLVDIGASGPLTNQQLELLYGFPLRTEPSLVLIMEPGQ